MGLTKITKKELKSWRDRYEASLRNLALKNETIHCTLFYSELKEFVDYIEERNQIDEEKKIGCVRFYFVRPEREFHPDANPPMESNPDKAMTFVYNPLSVKKANSEGESYPQMRIAMVPMTGKRFTPNDPEFDPENPKFAILEIYSEKDHDKEVMCLYPGTALREKKENRDQDIEIRKEKRMKRKIDRVKSDGNIDPQAMKEKIMEIEKEEEKGARILKQIAEKQDQIKKLVKKLELSANAGERNVVIEEMASEIERLATRKVELEEILATSKDEKVRKNAYDEINIIRRGENLLSRRDEFEGKLLSKDEAEQRKAVDEIRSEFTNFEVEYYNHTLQEPGHPGEHRGLCPPGGCQ